MNQTETTSEERNDTLPMNTDDDVVPVEKGQAAVEGWGLFSLLTAATKFCEQSASESRVCPSSGMWSIF